MVLFGLLLALLGMTVQEPTAPGPRMDATATPPPDLTLHVRQAQPIRLNQFDQFIVEVRLTGPQPDPATPAPPLNVPEGTSPVIVLTAENGRTSRLTLRDLKPSAHESSRYISVTSKGEHIEQWTPPSMTWYGRFETMNDALPAGRYAVHASYPQSGAAATAPVNDVLIEAVTLEQAKAAGDRETGDQVWLSLDEPDAQGEKAAQGGPTATLHNRSGRAIDVYGYVDWNDPAAMPAEPISTLIGYETYRAGGFQNGVMGYCGTGVGKIRLEADSKTRLRLPPCGPGFVRYTQPFTFVDEPKTQGKAYSPVIAIEKPAN